MSLSRFRIIEYMDGSFAVQDKYTLETAPAGIVIPEYPDDDPEDAVAGVFQWEHELNADHAATLARYFPSESPAVGFQDGSSYMLVQRFIHVRAVGPLAQQKEKIAELYREDFNITRRGPMALDPGEIDASRYLILAEKEVETISATLSKTKE